MDYCHSLFQLINDSYLEYKFQNSEVVIEPLGVIRNEILLCRLNQIPLKMSTKIIVKRKNNYPKYIESEINEIQVNHKKITEIDGSSDLNVGISLFKRISNRNKFKISK